MRDLILQLSKSSIYSTKPFIHTIIVLHLLLNTFPDIYDFVFYYEFFLMVFFCGLPLCLCIRMV
ncbi:hypothetical protein ACR91K_23145, partial [Klebsiella pneumoniae]